MRTSQKSVLFRSILMLGTMALLVGGCGSHIKLKPMPVIYGPGKVDLCSLIPTSKQSADVRVFYATNRTPKGIGTHLNYSNGVDDTLHLGIAAVRMGGANTSWDEICRASNGQDGNPEFSMVLATELGQLEGPPGAGGSANDDQKVFLTALDQQLALTPNHEVNIYIHGFKTYMSWEVEVLSKLFHCSGRRGAMICFSWPSRQRLLQYAGDVRRGRESAHHLADLIELVASRTKAEHINILAYSAGAAVAADGLEQLRQRHPNENAEQLSKRLRIGNIIFAASDIDLKTFVREQLSDMKDLAQNVLVYISTNDAALGLASKTAGASRLGRPDVKEFSKAELDQLATDPKLQVVDVTDVPGPHEAEGMGGHGYWYANDWVLTDLLVSFRWQIKPDQRGLYRKEGMARWFFPRDYPEKITAAVRQLAAQK